MRLLDLLRDATDWIGDVGTIYAVSPWLPDAEAIILNPAPDTTETMERDGQTYAYFLETFLIQEFMEGLESQPEWGGLSEEQKCDRLIQYAMNDA